MVNVSVTIDGEKVIVNSPYHPDFPAPAKAIGGKFSSSTGTWTFAGRDEQRVRDLCREVYGTDGTPGPTVDVHVSLDALPGWDWQSLYFAGRQLVSRRHRDDAVRLGEDVIVIAGGFPSSGGSVKNPRITAEKGTVLEVRGVPAGHPDITTEGVTVIGRDEPPADRETLSAEREQLLARLAEIDEQLGRV